MLAELLRAQMKARGWQSRDPLIRKSGLSQAQISKLVRGERVNITVDTADCLASALDISAEEILRAALADVRASKKAKAVPETRAAVGD